MIGVYTRKEGEVWFGVACDDEKVFATSFGSDEKSVLQGLLGSLPFSVPFQQFDKTSALADRVIRVIKNVYDGKEPSGKVPFAMNHLSRHTQKVLKAACLIQLGYVTSYGGLAKATGASPRGVGRVMALNPFAPIVPCHRVVGSDFSLVGYGSGLANKLKLLKREKKGFTAKKEISVDGRKLMVFPVEFALKKAEKD